MSQYNSTFNRNSRTDNDTLMNQQNLPDQPQDRYLSICQKFNERVFKQQQAQKSMDMVYNYMVKNDIKAQKKSDVKQQKVRKTRKDKEGRKFICGACKLGYLSYPALYTHIKTKHKGETPDGTIRGESGKPKKRGRPKVRKTPQIYERELQKNQFPKQLSGLVSRDDIQDVLQFQGIDGGQGGDQDELAVQISLKYFVGIVRELKKMQNTKIFLLPISKVVTTFLDNIKEYISEQAMKDFQDTFFHFLEYANKHHGPILHYYQQTASYYIPQHLDPNRPYCDQQLPYFVPLFVQQYVRRELTVQDEIELTLLYDFCKWLHGQKLTDVRITKEGAVTGKNEEA